MTKKFRILALFLIAVLLCTALTACGGSDVTTTTTTTPAGGPQAPAYQGKTVRAYAIKGPTGMSLASLMAGKQQTVFNYQFELKDKPDLVAPEIIKGNFDIAAVPTNLAATLYKKTNGELQVIALNTLGVLYLMENGNTITSLSDLNGKTIYYFGQASTPQYILEYVLQKNNITATLEPVSDAAALASDLASNAKAIAVLPEPNVSVALSSATQSGNTSLRVVLDLTKEWQKVSEGKSPIQGCLVARKAFLQEIGKDGLAQLLAELSASANFVKTDATAASVITAQGIVPKEPLAKKAITNLGDNLCFITGNDMKVQLSAFLNVLYTANPQSVGGQLPDDAFYAIP